MKINDKTMANLYRGLGYEYHTASLLWQMGFEAYKIDADFGFDIMSYNLKERTFKSISDRQPYFFQVKSRTVTTFKDVETPAGVRREADVEFSFGKEDFKRLLSEKNSFLVCYFIDKNGDNENIVGSFWLNNYQLKLLFDGKNPKGSKPVWKWFQEKGEYIILRTKIQTQAISKETIENKIEGINNKIEEIKTLITDKKVLTEIERLEKLNDSLKNWIGNASIINNNSSDNIYLYAINSTGSDSKRILNEVQTNFKNWINTNTDLPVREY